MVEAGLELPINPLGYAPPKAEITGVSHLTQRTEVATAQSDFRKSCYIQSLFFVYSLTIHTSQSQLSHKLSRVIHKAACRCDPKVHLT